MTATQLRVGYRNALGKLVLDLVQSLRAFFRVLTLRGPKLSNLMSQVMQRLLLCLDFPVDVLWSAQRADFDEIASSDDNGRLEHW